MKNFSSFYRERKIPVSAGILLYTFKENKIKVFLVTPGGPHWENKTCWGIPKGHVEKGESVETTAKREFTEETSIPIPAKTKLKYLGLVERRGKHPKDIHAFAYEGSGTEKFSGSNYTDMEWPEKSGKFITVPEIKEGRWFDIEKAEIEITSAQKSFVKSLKMMLSSS